MKILASNVIKKYGTRDPFEIAKRSGVVVVAEPLGNVYGYFNKSLGQKFIHVNDQLPEYFQWYVVAHLLYRVFTDPDEMLFLKRKLRAKFTESEKLANKFSVELLVVEAELRECGSALAFMKSKGMTDADIENLAGRLSRIWGNFPDREALFNFALEQVRLS